MLGPGVGRREREGRKRGRGEKGQKRAAEPRCLDFILKGLWENSLAPT